MNLNEIFEEARRVGKELDLIPSEIDELRLWVAYIAFGNLDGAKKCFTGKRENLDIIRVIISLGKP